MTTTRAFNLDFDGFRQEKVTAIMRSAQYAISCAVPGDFAEFGISMGTSFQVLAATIYALDSMSTRTGVAPRSLIGFDSFQGMPQATMTADTEMPMVKSGIWGPGTCESPGIDAIRALAEQYLTTERVYLYPGWFKDSLPGVGNEHSRYALVHIDCDFYESTTQVLEHLFGTDRLSDGAILLFDDFLENRGSPELGQRKAWEECKAKYRPRFTDLGFYSLSSWRCIVHKDAS